MSYGADPWRSRYANKVFRVYRTNSQRWDELRQACDRTYYLLSLDLDSSVARRAFTVVRSAIVYGLAGEFHTTRSKHLVYNGRAVTWRESLI